MKIKISEWDSRRFADIVFVYFLKKFFYFIVCFLFIPFLFSCFSSEQETVRSPISAEKETQKETKISLVDTVQESEDAGNFQQKEEPVRVQSTLTPITGNQNTQEIVSTNTFEVPTSLKGGEVTGEQKESREEILSEQNVEKDEESMSSIDPFSKIKVGMGYEEVTSLLGAPDFLITQSADRNMKLYRWNRESKVLYGRFENNILKRCSGKTETDGTAPIPLTRELYDQLKEGMELDEVVAILQRAGTQVSSDNRGGILYLWTDKGGSSFSARFENNKLVRKSGFYVRPVPIRENQIEEVPETVEVLEGAVEEKPTNEMEEVSVEEDADISPSKIEQKEQVPVENDAVSQVSNRLSPQSVGSKQNPIISSTRRIVYAGSQKRFLNEDSGSGIIKQSPMRRKVKLPGYTYQLREGSYEITIHNPLDTSVKLGLRSGKRGKNISIPAGGVKSVKVPRGDYQFVYIRDDEPAELQQGGNVRIDGLFVGDIEVMLLK